MSDKKNTENKRRAGVVSVHVQLGSMIQPLIFYCNDSRSGLGWALLCRVNAANPRACVDFLWVHLRDWTL